ncbi:chemotaxis protein CheW [Microcoleus sp. FACHB-68]|uniref:chemotaxis protein CheW n=1 Tax=Microcoleus sp. FACHB-68 TaxID=2692826 RepID=UPI001685B1A8|nr:chemotaxis protein CheW [Microcoleus sp. FACHB-68]MBD1938674.1 purine-binding chemotaxis protein CheW [Microcoleus sp. FACHB-68]
MNVSVSAGSNSNGSAGFHHTATTQQFLLFGQEGSLFAVELITVREVLCLNDQSISPIPNALPFVLGLTNLRGEILAVGDFGRLIGAEPVDTQHSNSRILVIEAPEPQDVSLRVMRMGLAVSQVDGVLSLNTEEIVSAVEVSEELAPLLKGLYDSEGRLVMILDVEAIAQSERW